MRVPRYDYTSQFGEGLPALLEDLGRMLRGGNYVLSREVNEFEEAFASYLAAEHVCGVNSGTDALVLALKSLAIGTGDEVITQANTFHATVAAICQVGATPVLVDAREDSFLMDTDQLADALTPRTRAVIPVHLFGKPTPLEPIQRLAEQYQLDIIEDAAQAHGARIHGQRVGTIGRIGCFSFHPSKNLAAAGDGGALVTNDASIAEQTRRLRGLGQTSQNNHVIVGYNSKLDAIQARVLSEKLPRLDAWNASRRRIAGRYRELLTNVDVGFQSRDGNEEHVYHQFQIRVQRRDELQAFLKAAGIDAVVRYPTPIHLQPAFAHCGWRQEQFPVSTRLANELLCLPIRPNMPDDEISYTAEKVREFCGKNG